MPLDPSKSAREADRHRQLKRALIVFNNRNSTLPCSLRDISETGARLETTSAHVPDHFELFVEMDGLTAPCQVIWRRTNMIGVHFTSPPVHHEPARTQVIVPVAPAAKPTLRRKPIA